MSSRKKKRRGVPQVDPPRTDGGVVPTLRMIIPDGLLYQIAHPDGVLARDPPRSGNLYAVGKLPIFAHVPEDERRSMTGSAMRTYSRAAYHFERLMSLRRQLDIRRNPLPGEVSWDSMVQFVHFELQAFAGASRTLLDELVYIIARRHRVPPTAARHKPWEPSDLIQRAIPKVCDVEEVRLLRSRSDWFETLNAYRNSFFHHGWIHGNGHFSDEDFRGAARPPASNGLILPDRKSLLGRKKPFEWSWQERKTVDEVAATIRDGMDSLIDELTTKAWAIPNEELGSIPMDQQPNVLVRLVKPALLEAGPYVVVPVFTTRERGLAFKLFAEKENLELVDAPVSSAVIAQPAVTFSLSGIENAELVSGATWIDVIVDPGLGTAGILNGSAQFRHAMADLVKAGSIQPVSISVSGIQRAWLWQPIQTHDWV